MSWSISGSIQLPLPSKFWQSSIYTYTSMSHKPVRLLSYQPCSGGPKLYVIRTQVTHYGYIVHHILLYMVHNLLIESRSPRSFDSHLEGQPCAWQSPRWCPCPLQGPNLVILKYTRANGNLLVAGSREAWQISEDVLSSLTALQIRKGLSESLFQVA